MSYRAAFFGGLREVADPIGALLTLIGIPAAVFGACTFSGEIVDSMTRPDIAMSIERLTLRCFFDADDQ